MKVMLVYEIFVNGVSDGYSYIDKDEAGIMVWELKCAGYDVEVKPKIVEL